MNKKIALLLLSISLIVGYAGIGKTVVPNDASVVLAEEVVDDEDTLGKDEEPSEKPEKPEEPEKPTQNPEPKPKPNPEPEPKPTTPKQKDKKTDEGNQGGNQGSNTNGPNTNTPANRPAPETPSTTTPQPVQTNQVEQNQPAERDEPVADVADEVNEDEQGDEEVDEEVDEEEAETMGNDEGYLTLAELKEIEVMITQEDGDFYVIFKDEDDKIVKQKITEFAAIQLGYEKEVIEKEEEKIDNVELTTYKNDGILKKMFGIFSAGTIILGLIIGTYIYYRKKMT